jgi:hypothetical protein
MYIKKLIKLILPVLVISVGCQPPKMGVIDQYTPHSDFVFSGTLLLTGTSTIDATDASDLAVVEVDQIFKGREQFKSFAADKITLKLKDRTKVVEGGKYIFFTRSWIFSESLGLIEVGNQKLEPSTNLKEVQKQVDKVEQTEKERELKNRLSLAELVVSGQIIDIKRFQSDEGVTEHAPEWQRADIKVDKVMKGTPSGDTISFLFAGSKDVMWYNSPKFDKNSTGIWLLKSYEYAGRKLELRAIVDKKDFYLKDETQKIMEILKK